MKIQNSIKHIAVLGAGTIGCYVGATWSGALASAGIKLTLIGRSDILSFSGATSLKVSGNDDQTVGCDLFERTDDATRLGDADIIFIATKATAIDKVITDIQANAAPNATIISLLNGLEPVRQLRNAFPNHTVLAGMVPFNVVWRSAHHLHQSSAGTLSLEYAPATQTIADLAASSMNPIDLYKDLQPIQYGKLLLNLINPINALSGLPLHAMLSQRTYRKIYAATVAEALSVYDKSGVNWKKVGPISPRLAVKLLPSPNFFFNNTLLKLQKIDKTSMTSMGSDIQAKKPTEIAVINEEIVRWASDAGITAPINAKLTSLIRQAEQSEDVVPLTAEQLAKELGL